MRTRPVPAPSRKRNSRPGAYSLVRTGCRTEAVADVAVEARDVELGADRALQVEAHVAADALEIDARVGRETSPQAQVAAGRAQPRARRIAGRHHEIAAHRVAVHLARDARQVGITAHGGDGQQAGLAAALDLDVAAHGLALDVLGRRLGMDVAAHRLQALRPAHARRRHVGADGVDRKPAARRHLEHQRGALHATRLSRQDHLDARQLAGARELESLGALAERAGHLDLVARPRGNDHGAGRVRHLDLAGGIGGRPLLDRRAGQCDGPGRQHCQQRPSESHAVEQSRPGTPGHNCILVASIIVPEPLPAVSCWTLASTASSSW